MIASAPSAGRRRTAARPRESYPADETASPLVEPLRRHPEVGTVTPPVTLDLIDLPFCEPSSVAAPQMVQVALQPCDANPMTTRLDRISVGGGAVSRPDSPMVPPQRFV